MRATKNNWLKATTGISLVLGLILGVNAFEKKADVADNIVTKTEKVATQVKWYETDATGQIMVSLRTTPPPTGSGSGCYQSNSGDFCAREIQFDASVNPADLEGKNLKEIENDFGEIELKRTAKHNN